MSHSLCSFSASTPADDESRDIIHTRKCGRHYVSCVVCCRHPDVVRIHGHKSRLPAMATEAGTLYRKTVLDDHLSSAWHREAKKCDRLSKLNQVEVAQQAPMNQLISRSNEALANKVWNLIISVYNDAKRWPRPYTVGLREWLLVNTVITSSAMNRTAYKINWICSM